jgi:hypothetical protein
MKNQSLCLARAKRESPFGMNYGRNRVFAYKLCKRWQLR